MAVLLWLAAVGADRLPLAQVAAALASAVLLWSLYFVLGFRAFSRGVQASGLGLLLTIGLPLSAYVVTRLGGSLLGALLPPGLVYSAHLPAGSLTWLLAPLLLAGLAVVLARRSLRECDRRLRLWYDQHHSSKVMT